MKLAIGCDHGALALKNKAVAHLTAKGYDLLTSIIDPWLDTL